MTEGIPEILAELARQRLLLESIQVDQRNMQEDISELRTEQRQANQELRGDLVLITSKLHDENQETKKKFQTLPTSFRWLMQG